MDDMLDFDPEIQTDMDMEQDMKDMGDADDDAEAYAMDGFDLEF